MDNISKLKERIMQSVKRIEDKRNDVIIVYHDR